MAASATILSPLQGDTVNTDNVVISVCYAGCTTEKLIDTIAAMPDTATAETGDGLQIGTPIMRVPNGLQRVATGIANAMGTAIATELDYQNGVNVTGGDTPVPIMEPVPERTAHAHKLSHIDGKALPAGSAAAYVVCQVIEVNATTGTRTVITAGATTATAGKKWKVTFDTITLNAAPTIQYVARAFVYDKNQTLIGSESIPIKK